MDLDMQNSIIKPAKLPLENVGNGKKAKVAGWGVTENGFPDTLRKLDVVTVEPFLVPEKTSTGQLILRLDVFGAHAPDNSGYGISLNVSEI